MPSGGKRRGAGRKKTSADPVIDSDVSPERQRELVALYVGAGLSPAQIARAMHTTVQALTAAFADELSGGKDIARANNLRLLHEQAVGGSVTALKAIEVMLATPAEGAPLGVKATSQERANAAAKGKFAPRPAPSSRKNT